MARLIEAKPDPTTTITIRVSTSTERKWKACTALAKKVRANLYTAIDPYIEKFCDKAIEEMSETWNTHEESGPNVLNGRS